MVTTRALMPLPRSNAQIRKIYCPNMLAVGHLQAAKKKKKPKKCWRRRGEPVVCSRAGWRSELWQPVVRSVKGKRREATDGVGERDRKKSEK